MYLLQFSYIRVKLLNGVVGQSTQVHSRKDAYSQNMGGRRLAEYPEATTSPPKFWVTGSSGNDPPYR